MKIVEVNGTKIKIVKVNGVNSCNKCDRGKLVEAGNFATLVYPYDEVAMFKIGGIGVNLCLDCLKELQGEVDELVKEMEKRKEDVK